MRGALRIAGENPHLDFAIIDVDLAGEPDGVLAAGRLRTERDIALLFVSASLDDATHALAWNPVGFVGKPFQEREILRSVSRLPGRSAA